MAFVHVHGGGPRRSPGRNAANHTSEVPRWIVKLLVNDRSPVVLLGSSLWFLSHRGGGGGHRRWPPPHPPRLPQLRPRWRREGPPPISAAAAAAVVVCSEISLPPPIYEPPDPEQYPLPSPLLSPQASMARRARGRAHVHHPLSPPSPSSFPSVPPSRSPPGLLLVRHRGRHRQGLPVPRCGEGAESGAGGAARPPRETGPPPGGSRLVRVRPTALPALRGEGAVARRRQGLPLTAVPALRPLLRAELVERQGRGAAALGPPPHRLARLLLLLPRHRVRHPRPGEAAPGRPRLPRVPRAAPHGHQGGRPRRLPLQDHVHRRAQEHPYTLQDAACEDANGSLVHGSDEQLDREK